jgi:hypothetical protein
VSKDVQTYDLIIVGAGSGNMIPVPEMENWRLAIVEPDKFGGTCLNRGCIPSKMLLYPAEVVETARHAATLGVHHTLDRVDWRHIVARVWQKIDPIAEAGAANRQSQPHITVYDQQDNHPAFPSRLTYHPSFAIVRSANPNFCLVPEPWAAGKIAKSVEKKRI